MPDPPPEESYADQALAEADRYLEWERAEGAELDGTDDSIWFLQGILQSMHQMGEEGPLADVKRLAYAVYVARLYERTCPGVRMYVTDNGEAVDGVLARGPNSVIQFTLNWVTECIEDPDADNIVFKYACGLRDFGEVARATDLLRALEAYTSESSGSGASRRWGRRLFGRG